MSSSGLVNGDTLSGLLATSATTTSNVGSYGITQGTLAASSNYALSYVGANLTVTAAPLTVTADAQTRLYGAANPALTYVEFRPGQRRHAVRRASPPPRRLPPTSAATASRRAPSPHLRTTR